MTSVSHLLPPSGKDRAYKVVLRVPGHDRPVKVMGFRLKGATETLQSRIDLLLAAKLNCDPPPVVLSKWIEGMRPKLAKRLMDIGLLPPERMRHGQPLAKHYDAYEVAVAGRTKNTPEHAKRQRVLVERLFKAMNANTLEEVTISNAEVCLSRMPSRLKGKRGLSASTRRGYLIAALDFGRWMVDQKLAASSPLEGVKLPKPSEDRNRRALTHEEFRVLMRHLATAKRAPNDQFPWTPQERRLIYWTAVFTGLRADELRSRLKHHLRLKESPAWVEVEGKDSKNKEWGSVPIPDDLADALRQHVATLHNATPIFRMPNPGSLVKAFRRDLKAAGVELDMGDGKSLDFHALRHTAITWWLLAGIDQLQVQRLARLKTLSMVQRYSRNFRLKAERTDWLDKMPKFGAADAKAAKTA